VLVEDFAPLPVPPHPLRESVQPLPPVLDLAQYLIAQGLDPVAPYFPSISLDIEQSESDTTDEVSD